MTSSGTKRFNLPILITLGLIVVIGGVFLIEVFSYSETPAIENMTNADLESEAARLVAMGNAANGESLVTTYQCVACHVIGAENGIAPHFAGVALRAPERRPPLSAAAYIYESILNPSAFLVEDYQNSMVQNFDERITDQELADIIAYLLTLTTPLPEPTAIP